jgi:isoleucyl-tRNA synthetase
MRPPLELKKTLNLPKTDFSMKANLPQNEPKWLERWEKMGIYAMIRESRKGAPSYVLHDGPPYANGAIHEGHALNKCLKDFVVKSKTMAGFDSPYVPGWDCHGLPIEIKVDEALGRKKLEMPAYAVRRKCREYAEKYLNIQRDQFKRLGILGRWEQPYSTMTQQYESVIVRQLFDFLENGAVYKGLRPVYWCIHDKTALAEAEIEYSDHTSPSVWVKYQLTSDPAKIDPALAGKIVATIIWTTTPWTLPASMAVAFHPDLEYVVLEHGGEVYIVAEALAKATIEACKFGHASVVARFPGRQLEYATFAHPFLDRQILGVLANYVTTDQGTGAVHTAPSHGADDFYTGSKYKLDQRTNVDEAGHMQNGLPEYEGKTVFQANQPIIELLKARGVLMAEAKIEHSYPHCWRCHNPVIFRATEQWFISMEAKVEDSTLRQRSLDEIKKVKWFPAWGEERISNMIATRPDWCISRQRVWGVPIAVFFCEGCGKLLDTKESHRIVKARMPGTSTRRKTFFQREQRARAAPAPHSAKRLTSSTCGLNPVPATPPCLAMSPGWPGPPIFISKAAINIAAGSTLPCSSPWARAGTRPIAASPPTDGRSIHRERPHPSLSATELIRSRSPRNWAPRSSGCGWLRSTFRKM